MCTGRRLVDGRWVEQGPVARRYPSTRDEPDGTPGDPDRPGRGWRGRHRATGDRRVRAGHRPALAEGGVRAFEITLNDPEADALRAIEAVARAEATRQGGPCGERLAIGAGTVLSVAAAQRAVDAGATFLVMPHTDPEIVAWAAERGVPAFPGAATPTEVLAGWRAGAAAIKVFPASSLGPSFVRELRGPLPDVPLVPTGGVSAENAGAFIAAGALAVGPGQLAGR